MLHYRQIWLKKILYSKNCCPFFKSWHTEEQVHHTRKWNILLLLLTLSCWEKDVVIVWYIYWFSTNIERYNKKMLKPIYLLTFVLSRSWVVGGGTLASMHTLLLLLLLFLIRRHMQWLLIWTPSLISTAVFSSLICPAKTICLSRYKRHTNHRLLHIC